jgi:uncharacterized membrane protein
MNKKLIIFIFGLLFLLLLILAIIPIEINNIKFNQFQNDVNKEIKFLQSEIDSLRKVKNDTIFIKPFKIEIYERSES